MRARPSTKTSTTVNLNQLLIRLVATTQLQHKDQERTGSFLADRFTYAGNSVT